MCVSSASSCAYLHALQFRYSEERSASLALNRDDVHSDVYTSVPT